MTHSIKNFFKSSVALPSTLWILAFICALYPINAWQLGLFAAAVCLVFVWSYGMLSNAIKQGWRVPTTPVLYFAGAFWALTFLSIFWSGVKPISLMAFCLFSVMPLTFFSGILGGTADYFKKIVWVLAPIFALLSIWAMVQYFFYNKYFMGQAHHPLADPSSLGSLLSLGLFCSLGWVMASTNNTQKTMAIILSWLLTGGILSTVARGPFLAILPALGMFVWLLWPQIKQQKKAIFILFSGVAAFFAASYFTTNKHFDIGERLTTMAHVGISHDHARLSIWKSAFEMIKDAPILGHGFGTFFLYFPAYRANSLEESVWMAHSDPIQFTAELGILAPILLYGFIAFACIRTWKTLSCLKQNPNSQDKILVVSIFCALIALVLASHVGFSQYNLSILMVEGLLLSIWFLATSRILDEKKLVTSIPKTFPKGVTKLLLATPYCMMAWMLLGIVVGEYFANRAAQDLFKEDMYTFAQDINYAGRFSNDQNFRAYILAVNVPLAILETKKEKIGIIEATNLYKQVVSYMDRTLSINPRATAAYYYLGKVQTLVPLSIVPPNTPSPEEYYKKALALDSSHLGSRLALNDLYARMKKPIAERVAFMEEGVMFSYNVTTASQYYNQMAKLYLESKDYGKARGIMAKQYNFEERAKDSVIRDNITMPQVLMGGY